jgi:carboxypeptidase PM20D1
VIKKTIVVILGLILTALCAVVLNTHLKGSKQLEVAALPKIPIDEAAVASRLGEAVRFRTISVALDPSANSDQFLGMQKFLEVTFPKLHATLQREKISDLSLLYTWKGTNPALKPMMLLAHQDVVPIAPGTEIKWQHPPFSGLVDGGFIWGRGAWDNKGNMMSQLEAVERLVASGYQPARTVYLYLGADEEIGGRRGAANLAKLMKQRSVQLSFVIDEGLLITDGVLPALKQPAALIGVAEKGYLTVILKFNAAPGHSSQPPRPGASAIGMMSAAIKRLDDNQLPAALRGVAYEMFDTLAPEMSGVNRYLLSNLWLFSPLIQTQLENGAATNAMIRSTTAATIVNAGNKDNVLPGIAEATLNFRLLPGDTRDSVQAHVRQQIEKSIPKDKYELFAVDTGSEASGISPTSSAQYRLVNTTLREVFPDVIVAPGLMIGATDSVHLKDISDHVFKFSPIRAKPEDLPRFHGTDERISTTNYADAIRFYHRLLQQAASGSLF